MTQHASSGGSGNFPDLRYPAWWWGVLAGLLVGWLLGFYLKPGADDLLAEALKLVPESSVVVSAEVGGEEFELVILIGPPSAHVWIADPSGPAELATKLDDRARLQGWSLLPAETWPGAIRRPVRGLFLEGIIRTRLHADAVRSDWDASIIVSRQDWAGPGILATSSLLVAVIGGFLNHRRHRDEPRRPTRWTLWLWAALVAALWLAALSMAW